MEAVIHDFYAHLKERRILGHRCQNCGTVSFPPRGLCTNCGTDKAIWVEISGKGKLLFASAGANLLLGKQYIMATVQLEEGPIISGVLLDDSFDFTRPETIWDYNCSDITVNAEVCESPIGGVIIAFRII
jgi:uncharacterized OB-fold protein